MRRRTLLTFSPSGAGAARPGPARRPSPFTGRSRLAGGRSWGSRWRREPAVALPIVAARPLRLGGARRRRTDDALGAQVALPVGGRTQFRPGLSEPAAGREAGRVGLVLVHSVPPQGLRGYRGRLEG